MHGGAKGSGGPRGNRNGRLVGAEGSLCASHQMETPPGTLRGGGFMNRPHGSHSCFRKDKKELKLRLWHAMVLALGRTMRLTFEHEEQPYVRRWIRFDQKGGFWLICTVQFSDAELKIMRQPNFSFSRSIGLFYVGHPKLGKLVRAVTERSAWQGKYEDMRLRRGAGLNHHSHGTPRLTHIGKRISYPYL